MSFSRNKNLTTYTVVAGKRKYFRSPLERDAYEQLVANSSSVFELSFQVVAKEVIQPGQALAYSFAQADPDSLAVVAADTTGQTVCGFYSGDEACAAEDTIKMVVFGPVNIAIDDAAAGIAKGVPVKLNATGVATIADTDNSAPIVCGSVTDETVQHTTAGGADLYTVTVLGTFKVA